MTHHNPHYKAIFMFPKGLYKIKILRKVSVVYYLSPMPQIIIVPVYIIEK